MHPVEKWRINYFHELLASNKVYFVIIAIIYHSAWSFNMTFITISIRFMACNEGKEQKDSAVLLFTLEWQTTFS